MFFCLNDFSSVCVCAGSHPGRPTGSDRFFTFTGLLSNPDRSSPRVDPLGRAGFYNYDMNERFWYFIIVHIWKICPSNFHVKYIWNIVSTLINKLIILNTVHTYV